MLLLTCIQNVNTFVSLSLLLSPEGGEGAGPYRHSNGTMSVAAEEDSSDQRSTETSEITASLLEWCLYEKVLDRESKPSRLGIKSELTLRNITESGDL